MGGAPTAAAEVQKAEVAASNDTSQHLPDTMTRMTFTSQNKTPSGFTPDKLDGGTPQSERSAVNAIRKDLNSVIDEDTPSKDRNNRGEGDNSLAPPVGAVGGSEHLTPKSGSRSASPSARSVTKYAHSISSNLILRAVPLKGVGVALKINKIARNGGGGGESDELLTLGVGTNYCL